MMVQISVDEFYPFLECEALKEGQKPSQWNVLVDMPEETYKRYRKVFDELDDVMNELDVWYNKGKINKIIKDAL